MLLKRRSLFTATMLLITISGISNIVGFVREMIIAANFGTVSGLGVYVVAQQIPLILYNTIYLGLPNLFIPLYHRWEKGVGLEDRVSEFARLWFLIAMIVTAVVMCFSGPLLAIIAPGLTAADKGTGTTILRISSLIIMAGGIFSVHRSIANAQNQFIIPMLAMLAGNVLIVASVYFGAALWGIDSLVWGTVFSIVFQTVIVAVTLRPSMKFFFGPVNRSIKVKGLLVSALPILLLEFVFALNYSLDYSFASNFSPQQIAALNYSMMLFRVPTIIIGISLGTTLLTRLSELITRNDTAGFKSVIIKSIMLSMYIVIPLSTAGYIFSDEIVRLSYQRGVFSEESVVMTSHLLRQLMPSVLAVTLYIFLTKVIATLQLNMKLLLMFGVMLLIKIALFHLLKESLGLLALTSMISFTFLGMIVIMLVLIQQRIGNLFDTKSIIHIAGMVTLAAASIAISIGISKPAGIIVMLTVLLLVKSDEREFFIGKVRQLLFSKVLPEGEESK